MQFVVASCIRAARRSFGTPFATYSADRGWLNVAGPWCEFRIYRTKAFANLPYGVAGVSSHGRVQSKRGLITWGSKTKQGYHATTIGGSFKYVHRLVARAFLGPPPDELTQVVNHKDWNPSNNHASNLEYVTPAQNVQHSYSNPKRNTCAAANSKPVVGRQRGTTHWQWYPSAREAARQSWCSLSSVHRCCTGVVASCRDLEFRFADSQPPLLSGEEWRAALHPQTGKPIARWKVSSLGRVKSSRNVISWGSKQRDGYRMIGASSEGVCANFRVHRLVARAFLGANPDASSHVVHHKDGDPGNNCVENLTYVTQAENIWHSWNTAFRCRTLATSKPVWGRRVASTFWEWYPSMQEASRRLGVHPSSISAQCRGTGKHAGPYEFCFAELPGSEYILGEEWREIIFDA